MCEKRFERAASGIARQLLPFPATQAFPTMLSAQGVLLFPPADSPEPDPPELIDAPYKEQDR